MSPSRRRKPGAVVIGGSNRALSVVRSLGRNGIEVWVVPTDHYQIAGCSRYARRRLVLRQAERAAWVAQLRAVAEAEALDGWVLIPTDDDEVELFAAHHDALSSHYLVSVPPLADVAWALNKAASYELASQVGVARPRCWSAADVAALPDADIAYPVIVKPTFRPRQLATRTPKAWRADNREQLERAYRTAAALMPADRLLIQELIPGGGEHQLAYAALSRDGAPLASLAVTRRRQWPRDFGRASSYVETVAEDELADAAERLLAASHYTGLIELEFKRDPRDGRVVLLDVNPRAWGWISISPRAGVDFPYLLWRMLVGAQVPRLHGRPGVRWVRLATDLPAAVGELRDRTLSPTAYAQTFRAPLACAIVALDDPLPALLDAPLVAGVTAGRVAARARTRAKTAGRVWHSRARSRTVASAAGLDPAPGQSGATRAPRSLIMLENAAVPGDRRVWHEALSLRRAGWSVTVLAPHAAPPANRQPTDEVMEGVQIRRFRLPPAEEHPFGHLGEYAIAMWRLWRELSQLAREHPFDVIHACNPPDFLLLAALGQRRRGTRLIFDHHDLAPELYACRSDGRKVVVRALLAFERLAFRVADVALVTNDSARRLLLERVRKAREDVFVVRNGPMLERFRPLPRDPELTRGREHLLVYVGVMGRQDGVDHAVRALAHLSRRRQDWHARFVGGGETLPQLRQLASELRVDEHIEFCGPLPEEDVRRAICSADVCLAPDPRNRYTDRSTLIKIAEYMALSRPTVSYDLTESRVTAGGAALYAGNNDPSEFAARIDELLEDPARRRELGAEGRARVERGLAWEHSEQALLAAYRRAIGKRSALNGAAGARAAGGAPTSTGGDLSAEPATIE